MIRSLLKSGHDQAVPVMHFMSLAGMSCIHIYAMLPAMVSGVMQTVLTSGHVATFDPLLVKNQTAQLMEQWSLMKFHLGGFPIKYLTAGLWGYAVGRKNKSKSCLGESFDADAPVAAQEPAELNSSKQCIATTCHGNLSHCTANAVQSQLAADMLCSSCPSLTS